MALTRAQVEQELIDRLGKWLTHAGKDGTTRDGSNADLNGPIGYAIRRVGYTVANIANVSTSDLASVTDAQLDEFLDVAELRALKNILGNLEQVNFRMGPISKDLSDLRASVEKRIATLEADINAAYGTNMPDAVFDNAPFYAPTGEDWVGVL